MVELFSGYPCEVTFRPEVGEGKAILTDKNTIRAKAGSKIKVTVDGKIHYLSVDIVTCISENARDNIQIKGPKSIKQGQFESITKFQYRYQKIREDPKAGLSLALTALSIVTATAATINASQHSQSTVAACTGLQCVAPLSWTLIGAAALSAIISWWKDNFTFL